MFIIFIRILAGASSYILLINNGVNTYGAGNYGVAVLAEKGGSDDITLVFNTNL